MEHGSRMRHQSKNPEYVAKLGVNNGVKGSGNPYIDQDLSTGNETILVGKQVILRCHIEDVKGKSVRKCNLYLIQLNFTNPEYFFVYFTYEHAKYNWLY